MRRLLRRLLDGRVVEVTIHQYLGSQMAEDDLLLIDGRVERDPPEYRWWSLGELLGFGLPAPAEMRAVGQRLYPDRIEGSIFTARTARALEVFYKVRDLCLRGEASLEDLTALATGPALGAGHRWDMAPFDQPAIGPDLESTLRLEVAQVRLRQARGKKGGA